MTRYQILYWEDIPAQVKVDDGFDELVVELNPRFQEKIDAAASQRGKTEGDAYMAAWRWSDPVERPGSLPEIAAAVKKEIETKFPL